MKGKYKNKKSKISNGDSGEVKQKNSFENFIKYFICFIALLIPFFCFYLNIKDYGFAGLFNSMGLFAIVFALVVFCIIALIFYDNQNKPNIAKKYGIILYSFLAISSTLICFTESFVATYYCEKDGCRVVTSSFLRDKNSKALNITQETESIGMNTILSGGSMTSMGIVMKFVDTIAYSIDTNNLENFKNANGANIKLKSFHSQACVMLIILSCIFIIPGLYLLYSWNKRSFYFLFFIILARILYILLVL